MTRNDQALLDAVQRLIAERDELVRHVDVLNAKLLEVTDPTRDRELVRAAYRRGYLTGRAAKRRGVPYTSAPERSARGWVRKAVRA